MNRTKLIFDSLKDYNLNTINWISIFNATLTLCSFQEYWRACDISSSHGGEYEAQNLLGYCRVLTLMSTDVSEVRAASIIALMMEAARTAQHVGRHSIKNTAVHPRIFWASLASLFLCSPYATYSFFSFRQGQWWLRKQHTHITVYNLFTCSIILITNVRHDWLYECAFRATPRKCKTCSTVAVSKLQSCHTTTLKTKSYGGCTGRNKCKEAKLAPAVRFDRVCVWRQSWVRRSALVLVHSSGICFQSSSKYFHI
jgi:hypothetical protein